jgi:DNA adenine methylase
MITQRVRSPLTWIGEKYSSVPQIVAAFPTASSHDTSVDLFGGAAHVLLHRPFEKRHAEVYNDINQDLVNFWMQCRDHAEELEARCRSLPYSRVLHSQYHDDLYHGEELDPLERAVRWFYVLRSTFNGFIGPVRHGWLARAGRSESVAYHTALDLFEALQRRLRYVLIDCRDFAAVLRSHDNPRTLFYVDPPSIEKEDYYQREDSTVFGLHDHERLAGLLNETSAQVALSYSPHPLLDGLYPAQKWRRVTWETVKHSQRGSETREWTTEMFLCNYPAPVPPTAPLSLWKEAPDDRQREGVLRVHS